MLLWSARSRFVSSKMRTLGPIVRGIFLQPSQHDRSPKEPIRLCGCICIERLAHAGRNLQRAAILRGRAAGQKYFSESTVARDAQHERSED